MDYKVFIIEDDANILYGLQAQLNAEGMDTIIHNGEGSIEGLWHEIVLAQPDYIILDLVLPDMDGFSVLSNLKSDAATKKIPVFVFANFSEEDVRARCDELGADYYFLKNEMNLEEFAAKFMKIIANREKRRKK